MEEKDCLVLEANYQPNVGSATFLFLFFFSQRGVNLCHTERVRVQVQVHESVTSHNFGD